MFTLTVRDEQVYRRLMEKIKQSGESLDEVLRDLLDQENQNQPSEVETPAQKLLRLIDRTELSFTRPFNARDAEEILSRETGETSWRAAEDDNGTA